MILADFHFPRTLRPAVAKAAEVACPPDIVALGLVDRVGLMVEHALRAYPTGVRLALVAGIAAFETGAVARYGRRFSRLGHEEAHDWFKSWWNSPVGLFRQLVRALKMLCALAYYDTEAARAKLEYHPDAWIAQVAQRRLDSYGVAIQHAEEELVAPDPLIPLGRKRQHA